MAKTVPGSGTFYGEATREDTGLPAFGHMSHWRITRRTGLSGSHLSQLWSRNLYKSREPKYEKVHFVSCVPCQVRWRRPRSSFGLEPTRDGPSIAPPLARPRQAGCSLRGHGGTAPWVPRGTQGRVRPLQNEASLALEAMHALESEERGVQASCDLRELRQTGHAVHA